MNIEEFDYNLPENLIAQTPLPQRDASKLMILNRQDQTIEHKTFKNIIDYLEPEDVLVLNDTKVIPARLIGYKEETKAHIEILLLKDLGNDTWECLARPAKRLKEGTTITLTKEEGAILKFLIEAFEGKDKITVKELERYIQKSQTKVVKLKAHIDKYVPSRLQELELQDKKEKEEYAKYNSQFGGNVVGLIFSILIGVITAMELTPLVLIAVIPLVILEIIHLGMISHVQSKINVFTQKGVDEIEKWKGLKKFMEEFSMLDKKELPEIVLWEKFLVYATVFGIAQKVLKQLKIVYPNIEEMVEINNYTYLYFMMHTNFSTSFSNAVSTSMSSSYSSATGGGGGFSGGGGGGRRPEVAVEADKPKLDFR